MLRAAEKLKADFCNEIQFHRSVRAVGKRFSEIERTVLELGFDIVWEASDYVGFENNGCCFILQNYDEKSFAENLMLRVTVDNLDEFRQKISEKDLPAKFGVKLNEPKDFPWGRKVNLIDIAGVCRHFAESK